MSQPNDPTPQPDPQVHVPEAEARVDPELDALHSQMLQLQALGKNGANWFYWVAALSLVNSVIAVVGGNRRFLFGLGVTQFSDAVAQGLAADNPNVATIGRIVAFGFALFVAAVVVLFGWLANKRLTPVFALGMGLYLLDGLLLLLFQDWIGAAFHGFVLYQMMQGINAYRQLSAILRTQPAVT